ncbi:MAG: hypothetical protein AAF725_18370, partial [Acidobacteriota bacterium]
MGRLNGSGEPQSTRPSPHWLRRWVARPLLWLLALLALSLSLLRWWIDTPGARERASREITARLSAALDREVSLEGVRFELLPFSLELRGFEIAGVSPEDPAFLRVPRALLEADLNALRRGRVHLRRVRVERPEIDLRFFRGGGDNLIATEGEGRKAELWIDRVEIESGFLRLDHERIPLDLEAVTLRTELRGLGDRLLEGRLQVSDVLLELPDARPIRVSVDAEGGLDAQRLRVDRTRVEGPGLGLTAEGECTWSGPGGEAGGQKCAFRTVGRALGQTLAELGYFGALRGEFGFEGDLGWRPGAFGWRGRVHSERVAIWSREVRGVEGELSADRFGLLLALDRAGYCGGSLEGDVNVTFGQPGAPLTVDLDFEDLWLSDLLQDQGLQPIGLAAWASGRATYRCRRSDGCRRGDGRAEVTLSPG